MKEETSRYRRTPEMMIGERVIGGNHPPFVIAEIGINHGGNFDKAVQMIDDAAQTGCECIKIQSHIVDEEMIKNDVVPANASTSIWEIISSCTLDFEEEKALKTHSEQKGLIFLSTPFSKLAADRLRSIGISAFKIGSGECNNYPLVRHIARFGLPVILSTGMNDIASIAPAVSILENAKVDFALLHCTSIYPTPYEHVRLGGLQHLASSFPAAVIGLSDHSLGNYTSFAAVSLGFGNILEKHFTSSREWAGPDVPISLNPMELGDLIYGSKAIQLALGGNKSILPEEQPTIDFAYSSVVSIVDIHPGEKLSETNCWVKRPGTGAIPAKDLHLVMEKRAKFSIPSDVQISWGMLCD
jgi:sialic acid synthase SpsE